MAIKINNGLFFILILLNMILIIEKKKKKIVVDSIKVSFHEFLDLTLRIFANYSNHDNLNETIFIYSSLNFF